MQVKFDSKTLPAAKRRQAWRDAICEIYLQVDCALRGELDRQPADERGVQRARLRPVTAYTDAHLSDPTLSLAEIAKRNGISLRHLHQRFRLTDMSASE